MATVYRKTVTKPLPAGAEIFTRKGERFAKWKNKKGKRKTAKLTTGRDGSVRISIQAGTFMAKYRDGQGIVREVATGCRTKDGALSVLRELTGRAEKVKARILTPAEDRIADHPTLALANSLLFRNSNNVERDAPPIRTLGTIGWIASGILIGSGFLVSGSLKLVWPEPETKKKPEKKKEVVQ